MDALQGFGELGMGSRLKRISEFMMKETQIVYDYYAIDFDPYLFPIFKIITHKNNITNTEIKALINISQPAITQSINKLKKKNLITISPCSSDKRKKIISLSEKGQKIHKKMIPIWQGIDEVIKAFTLEKTSSLIEHLNRLEDKLNCESFSEAVIKRVKQQETNALQIINYDNAYADRFYELNTEWLKTFFYVEPYDEEVLSNPEQYIINKGGFIFFAKLNNEIVGTVALMPIQEVGTFELTKMAVSPEHRGYKIGQKLMQHCLDFAKAQDFKRLLLYSSRKLENAIYIYRKYGFVEVPVEPNSPYKRSNIKMEYPL